MLYVQQACSEVCLDTQLYLCLEQTLILLKLQEDVVIL